MGSQRKKPNSPITKTGFVQTGKQKKLFRWSWNLNSKTSVFFLQIKMWIEFWLKPQFLLKPEWSDRTQSDFEFLLKHTKYELHNIKEYIK